MQLPEEITQKMFRGSRKKQEGAAAESTAADGKAGKAAVPATQAINPQGFVRVMRGCDPGEVDKFLAKLEAELARLRAQVQATDGQPGLADPPGVPDPAGGDAPENSVPDFFRVMRGYDPHAVARHIAQQAAEIRGLRARLQERRSKI